MSRTAPTMTESRPRLFDYLLLLAGMGLSLYFMKLAPIRAVPEGGRPDRHVAAVIAFLPSLMRVPEGIFLLWPLFFVTQWPGRSSRLTVGEWLGIVACTGVVLLTGLTAWEVLAGLPAWLQPHAAKPRLLWYALLMPGMAALAVAFLVVHLFRPPAPWTHNLALALILWPAGPALGVLILGKFVAP